MKKLFATLLAVCVLASLSVTAFAAEINQDSNTKKSDTEITFNVAPTYTVTIPATIMLEKDSVSGKYKQDASISAENVRLLEGKKINVSITSDFKLTTGVSGANYELPYTVKTGNSNTAISDGDTVAVFETNSTEQSETIHIEAEDPQYAGEYSDTVTFTVAVQ